MSTSYKSVQAFVWAVSLMGSALAQSSLPLSAGKVREKVMRATGGKQQPFEFGSLTGGELVLCAIWTN